MVQVWVVPYGRKEKFGPKVEDLLAARTVVKLLDQLAADGELPERLKFYNTDCDIIAIDDEGREWEYSDQDPSGASDGVWS